VAGNTSVKHRNTSVTTVRHTCSYSSLGWMTTAWLFLSNPTSTIGKPILLNPHLQLLLVGAGGGAGGAVDGQHVVGDAQVVGLRPLVLDDEDQVKPRQDGRLRRAMSKHILSGATSFETRPPQHSMQACAARQESADGRVVFTVWHVCNLRLKFCLTALRCALPQNLLLYFSSQRHTCRSMFSWADFMSS
jgi:hypothetical protein